MIDSVLNDVRNAEEKAENMQKQAYQRGKSIILKAEADAEAQKKSTVLECKQERAKILQDARNRADERTKTILKKGSSDADFLIEEKQSAIEEYADKIVEIVLGKYIEDEQTLQG